MDYIRTVLSLGGLPTEALIGRTPGASFVSGPTDDTPDEPLYKSREAEIAAWLALEAHTHVTRYAVLEACDPPARSAIAAHHVQTRAETGLSEADAAKARLLLAKPDGSFYFWAPSGRLRPWAPPPAAATPITRNKPGATVEGGVCSCTMLGSTLLIECKLCRKQLADRRVARSSSKSLTSLSQSRGSLKLLSSTDAV